MVGIPGLRGMRHIAIKVKDVGRSKAFYQEILGMQVVWEPDPKNVYLSSGPDNLALHELGPEAASEIAAEHLDHFGFVAESAERVRQLEEEFRRRGVRIVNSFKVHRDGSASFYFTDPDGILIQILYAPHLSPQEIR